MLDSDKPKGCEGYYIPWTCGTCPLKRACRPPKAPGVNV